MIKTKCIDEFFMKTVYEVAGLSKDPKTKIGSVLVKDRDIISVGYNNFPRKVVDLEERYNNRELKQKFVVHSESNAILNAARKGSSTLNSTLYTQGIPCQECMKSIIQAGITTVFVHKQWPNLTHSQHWVESVAISEIMIEEAGVELKWLDKVLNVEGWLDGKSIKV